MKEMIEVIREYIQYNGLLVNLIKKELKLKYKNSTLGFLWSLLNPMLMIIVYTLAFKIVLKVQIQNFPIFVFTGLLPWNFFQTSLLSATGSIIANSHLVQKVYFPRGLIPLSVISANFINFCMTLIVLFATLVFNGYFLGTSFIMLPFLMLIQFLITVGISFFLSGITVKFRDVSHLIEVFLGAWFYLTPVVYPLNLIPEAYKKWILLNPMTSIIEMYRKILLDNELPSLNLWLNSIVIAVILLVIGLSVFKKLEKKFAEEL